MIGVRETHRPANRDRHGSGNAAHDSRQVRPISILHTVSSLNVGGMEQVVLRLASAQRRAGHNVAVLALRGGPLVSDLRERGVPVRVLNGGRVSRIFSTGRYVRGVRPDVIHAHNPTSLHYSVIAAVVSRTPVVLTIHGDQQTHARLGSSFEWRFVAAAAVVSEAALHGLDLPINAEKLTVIRNGIETAVDSIEQRSTVCARQADGERCSGVMVARIDGRKGHATLLDSLRHLKEAGVKVLVNVVGDGARRQEIERRAAELSLDESVVKFLGTRTDVSALLASADFFVLPSDTEGLPLSVLEAMAQGVPIIASRVGGIPEVITNGRDGLLIEPGNAVELATAIRTLCGDCDLRKRLGIAALERVRSAFTMEATVNQYNALYRRALSPA